MFSLTEFDNFQLISIRLNLVSYLFKNMKPGKKQQNMKPNSTVLKWLDLTLPKIDLSLQLTEVKLHHHQNSELIPP